MIKKIKSIIIGFETSHNKLNTRVVKFCGSMPLLIKINGFLDTFLDKVEERLGIDKPSNKEPGYLKGYNHFDEPIEINPATGLPMAGRGIGGVDVSGNPYGVDIQSNHDHFQ